MKLGIDTVHGYFSKYRSVKIITHIGFKRTIFINKKNKVIKDVIKIYNSHPLDCSCGFKKSKTITWNTEEIKKTNP